MSVALICNGSVTLTAEGAPVCDVGWLTVDYAAVVPFDPSMLDLGTLGAAYGTGFLISVIPIAVAYGISEMLSLLDKG